MNALAAGSDLRTHYDRHLAPRWRRAPYVLRITEWKDLPVPVLVVKERQALSQSEQSSQVALPLDGQPRSTLMDRGHLAVSPCAAACPSCAASWSGSVMIRQCPPVLSAISRRKG